LLKPVILSLLAIAVVWAVLAARGGFPIQLGRGAAVALLRAETGRQNAFGLSAESLLALGSPLLVRSGGGEAAQAQDEAPSAQDAPAEAPPEMVPTLAPYMTPLLPYGEETDPPVVNEGWDDRVWSVPGETDPGAHPLREVTLLPMSGEEYLTDGTVAVNNDTRCEIDVPSLLAAPSKLIPAAADGPQVLIIHTHGSESFLPDERDFYIPTDIERTEDTRYNVVRLGDEITERLEAAGLTVAHDRSIHDFPTFSNSYERSLESIQSYVEQYPTIQVVLDIHRDSVTQADGTMFKPVCESEYGKTAQMMFVAGSNDLGLPHDNWRDNLAFAAKLQSRLLEVCPTLMRPIHLREERFNQHATPGSLILEIGTAGNSLTEALRAANLFCDVAGPYLAEELLAMDNGQLTMDN
jgi:stage II sporulation protein P